MEELFGEVMVPTEEVVEIRGGQRRKSERKFFPGYVLVQMVMNDASWHWCAAYRASWDSSAVRLTVLRQSAIKKLMRS